MSNYLYNGIELPELPEWDKAAYPYAFIFQNNSGSYLLRLSSAKWIEDSYEPGAIAPSENGQMQNGVIKDGAWIIRGTTSFSYESDYISDTIIWASFDIIGTDGSVMFAASEPVDPNAPTDPIPEYMLYNGVELPNIDTVWTDKGTYPYAHVLFMTDDGDYYLVLICNKPLSYVSGKLLPLEGSDLTYSTYWCDAENPLTNIELDATRAKYSEDAEGLTWTSYDIVNRSDGTSVYFAASEPIPVESEPMPEFMLYNGVELPNIEKVWTDKDTYPYGCIYYANEAYGLAICSQKLSGNDGNIQYNNGTVVQFCELIDGNWVSTGDAFTMPAMTIPSQAVYTNYDMPKIGNTAVIYLAGSDPVPVGGGGETETLSFINFLRGPNCPYLPKNVCGWKLAQKRECGPV